MRVFSLAFNQVIIHLMIIIAFVILYNSKFFTQDRGGELKSLSESADIIIIGKVIQQKSSWNEGKTRIFTEVTIDVEEYLKGSNVSNIVVTHPGGEVGEVGELYTHMPKFRTNEETLLFLEKNKQGNGFRVLNGEKGKITLVKDSVTGEKLTSTKEKISTFKNQIKKYIEEE